jgi:hypothetical protein
MKECTTAAVIELFDVGCGIEVAASSTVKGVDGTDDGAKDEDVVGKPVGVVGASDVGSVVLLMNGETVGVEEVGVMDGETGAVVGPLVVDDDPVLFATGAVVGTVMLDGATDT